MARVDQLTATARAWLAQDPDPGDRAELIKLLDNMPSTRPELADRFDGSLTFGTAGLRGVMRAGPNGMNQAVVRRASAGLVGWLARHRATGPLVIGYDARHGSRRFAEETARVATGAGRAALLLPRALPTPVLAHAVRAYAAAAGVMITASHNPPADNGYKVYLGPGLTGRRAMAATLRGAAACGAQLVAPADREIEESIRQVDPAQVRLGPVAPELGEDAVESYLAGALAVLAEPHDPARAGLRIAYTPLHGVGAGVMVEALRRAGFATPAVVASQARPDPDFPTVAFPNPEEPGAMDRLLALARGSGSDVAIAHDPDADRCAVAIPDLTATGGWRVLTGDEVGVLLADHLIRRGTRGWYATTVVSSTLLRRLCQARGRRYAQTLTGFKWIVRAGGSAAYRLSFGYEEALGYCVAPRHVRDKDGITAALLVAELAAQLRAHGRGIADRLDEIAAEFGVYATGQVSIRMPRLERVQTLMDRLRARPPARLLGTAVAVEELAPGVLGLRSDAARVVVRPSGTEPKLKAYLESVEPVAGGLKAVQEARGRAAASLAALRAEVAAALR